MVKFQVTSAEQLLLTWLIGPCSVRSSLLLAALACILRPTNLLVWLCISLSTLWQTRAHERRVLILEAVICGYVRVLHDASAVIAFRLRD